MYQRAHLILVMLGCSLPAHAGWIDSASFEVQVSGEATTPSGSDSFLESATLEDAFGTRSVIGKMETFGVSAMAVASVSPTSILFSSFVGASALPFVESSANSVATYNFVTTQPVPTRYELSICCGYDHFNASISDEFDQPVMSMYATTTVTGGNPGIGEVTWYGEMVSLEDFLQRDWELPPGSYRLTMSTNQEQLAGVTGSGNYEFRVVPEPSSLFLLTSAMILASVRRRLHR